MSHSVKTPNYLWPTLTVVVGIYLLIVALPENWKQALPPFMNPVLHLGLDLQGGTQLDFRISEAEMQKQIDQLKADIKVLETDPNMTDEIAGKQAQISSIRAMQISIVESIRTVLERRVNRMGVSEAVITPSYYGAEKHLLVECPGDVDVQNCIKTIGKTILLEFKEEASGEDEKHIANMRELAVQSENRITLSGADLAMIGQDLSATLGVAYIEEDTYFEDELPPGLEEIWERSTEDTPILREVTVGMVNVDINPTLHKGMILSEVIKTPGETERTIPDPAQAMEYLAETEENLTLNTQEDVSFEDLDEGYEAALPQMVQRALLKGGRSDDMRTVLYVIGRTEKKEEMEASHILIAYTGADRAGEDVTRTKEEAQLFAQDLRQRIEGGESFEDLAKEFSDEPNAEKTAGSLGVFNRTAMAKAFSDASFLLTEKEVSDVVETDFGYHIIRADTKPPITPGSVSFMELEVAKDDAGTAQEKWLDALQNQTVSKTDNQITLQSLFFSFLPTGWKDTPLDGKHFQRATVTSDPITGVPVVQIVFDSEGGRLFQELTGRNIGKPIAIFVGGELVSAPTVQSEIPGGIAIITGSRDYEEANTLAQDLNTGAIPAPIYLVGQSTVEASLGAMALSQSLKAAMFGFLLVGLYMIFYYRVLGLIATVSLATYAIIFTALMKLPLFLFSGQYVVLTLAGIAGIILSIGMAVDANVLIFERMKEELKKGKMLSTAADTGFKRAWTSIWASNVSTLITAVILFVIGTSIVRGFAITLSLGILLSMFTAVVVTRFFIRLLYKSPIAENMAAFGVKVDK